MSELRKNSYSAGPLSSTESEIDLGQVTKALLRHKRLIATFAASTLVLSGLYAFTRKPIWEGQFQIVLRTNQSRIGGGLSQLSNANSMLADFAGINNISNASSLETEVKILESPSVLMPVFSFVRSKKIDKGENVNNFTFRNWLPNLTVELEKGTSVLNITYRDSDKALVIPVIAKVSNAYQQYSGRDRSRGLNNGIAYLEQVLTKLKPQADSSMRAAKNYALENGLGIQDGLGPNNSGTSITSTVEVKRDAVQKAVDRIKRQLESAASSKDNSVYIAPQLEASKGLYLQLQELETRLQTSSSLLKPNDPTILSLQRRRRSLIQVINQQTVGLLQGQLQTAQAELASLKRPREAILKHRELLRTAIRDDKTLTELESQLQALQLEKARQSDPWELISTPTLLDQPVAPLKKRIVALGLFAGLVLGSGAALLVDRRTGLVFSKEELQNLLPYPILKHLPALNPAAWNDAADLLASGPLTIGTNTGPIALIPIGALPTDQLQKFSAELERALAGRQLLVSTDLRETLKCDTQLLVTAPGIATRTQISQFCQKMTLQGAPVAGWVLLDPKLNL